MIRFVFFFLGYGNIEFCLKVKRYVVGVYIWLSKMGFRRKVRPVGFGELCARRDNEEKKKSVIGGGECGKRKKVGKALVFVNGFNYGLWLWFWMLLLWFWV